MEEKIPEDMKAEDLVKEIPEEVKKKFEQIKAKLDKLKKKILEKYKKEVFGIALLPPAKPRPGEKMDMNRIDVLVLVDDNDVELTKKFEYRAKIAKAIDGMSKEIDENIKVDTMLLFELRESCFDGKYEVLQLIAMSATIYDPNDLIEAIRVSEVHKSMVLKKFEKYVVSYVAAGSLFRGEKSNDIDVYIVIDDTDVKKMGRYELKDKLGAIIRGMGTEASLMTGVKKSFHIQVYILTDFWESVKDAHPVIFTFLRDGVPLFDRGVFMPWKLLLNMGRIRPSPEAIEMNMEVGEKMLERVKFKLLSAVGEDIYYATLNPSQAALMLYGVNPPTPKETVELLDKIFVKKEKLLEKKYVNILEKIRRYYKDIEHKKINEISGKDVDKLVADADIYLKRIKKLFAQIEKGKEKENFNETYNSCVRMVNDVLELKGKVSEEVLLNKFKKSFIDNKRLDTKCLETLKSVFKTKKEFRKMNSKEVEKVKRETRVFIRDLVDLIQRARGKELERAKIKVKYGDKFAEVLLLDKTAFITMDVDSKEKEIQKAKISKDGGLQGVEKSSVDELEKHLKDVKIPAKVFIKEKIFEDLRRLFGKDIEILVSY